MAALSEDDLIARYLAPLAGPGGFGLKDDAALLAPPPGHDLVVTLDAIVAGVHFLPDDPPDAIAAKALGVNLSDLAAKGAEPAGFLLALALAPGWTESWLAAFCDGLGRAARAGGCPLLGGDTVSTPGPLTLSVTAFGTVPAGRMVRRTSARPGDLLCVTGTIGDAALGLDLLVGAPPDTLPFAGRVEPARSAGPGGGRAGGIAGVSSASPPTPNPQGLRDSKILASGNPLPSPLWGRWPDPGLDPGGGPDGGVEKAPGRSRLWNAPTPTPPHEGEGRREPIAVAGETTICEWHSPRGEGEGTEVARPEDWRAALAPEHRAFLVDRYRVPRPRLALAAALREHASAAMDVSDGLAGDAAKMLRASGVTGTLGLDRIPLSPAARAALEAEATTPATQAGPALLDRIAGGGDDYEILFTLPPSRLDAMTRAAAALGLPVTVVGEVRDGEAPLSLRLNGAAYALATPSFQHFDGEARR